MKKKRRRWPPVPSMRGVKRLLTAAIIFAEAIHRVALIRVRAQFEDRGDPRAALIAQIDRITELLAVKDEELRILRSRMAEVPPRKRPHYPRHERFAILSLCCRTGWNVADTARRFLVTAATIAGWKRRLHDQGEAALVKPRLPVNRHSDRVALIVRRIHAAAPRLGKRKVADMLARVGLVLAASTVKRLRDRQVAPPGPKAPPSAPPRRREEQKRVVTAKRPHHLWHVDITTFAAADGVAVPWWPFMLPNLWPFSWHIAVVVDHFSRAFVAFAVFCKEPTAKDICRLLDRARVAAGKAPEHLVTDQGMQFGKDYLAWCDKNGTAPRFGAIGKHGSIAVVERFIRSLKGEHLRRVLIPFKRARLVALIESYQRWYNEHRPHEFLGGRTPRDVIKRRPRPSRKFEPRQHFPIGPDERVQRVADLELLVSHVDAHRHLPVIDLRKSA